MTSGTNGGMTIGESMGAEENEWTGPDNARKDNNNSTVTLDGDRHFLRAFMRL